MDKRKNKRLSVNKKSDTNKKLKMDKKIIKFGTDGWRGIIADDFIVENVKLVTQGVCEYLKRKTKGKNKPPRVIVGYDTRFLSDRFAKVAANVLGANDVETFISKKFIPTPVTSTAVVKAGADLGIMITASHNPYYYNGYKIKGPYGGSATMDIISEIEKMVNRGIEDGGFYRCYPDGGLDTKSNIKSIDFTEEYRNHILSLIDVDAVEGFKFGLLIDPMYGATQNIYRSILKALKPKKLVEVHAVLNPAFGNINPEPIGENLCDAIKKVREEQCKLAICLDGDGDRVAALGEDGNFISSHHIFAIVLHYLIRHRKLRGKVVKTVSTSSVIDRICSKYDLELIITPIGFKYISEQILKGGVIMGGEESGGIWVKGNIPERDGMLMGLILLEIMCREGKTINEILEDIYKDFGYFVYKRLDYEIGTEQKEALKALLSKEIPEILKKEGVEEVITIDGFKYMMQDGNWLMIRPSGTEAVVRIYAESNSEDKLNRLHSLGKKVIDSII